MNAPRSGGFKDHFSGHAADYARHRPRYPDALFRWLAGQAPGRALAWDVGTGNGQAALALAADFDAVHATDASAEQIAQAPEHPRVRFAVEPAEASSLDDATADLATVGQALHWFDLERFYAEAKRVLKPGGVMAAWTYTLCRVSPKVDAVVGRLHDRILAEHWPPERQFVDSGYRDLPFPFEPIEPPAFVMQTEWNAVEMLDYLGTWSAVRRFREAQGTDPLVCIADELNDAWGEKSRTVAWPLAMRVGRKDG